MKDCELYNYSQKLRQNALSSFPALFWRWKISSHPWGCLVGLGGDPLHKIVAEQPPDRHQHQAHSAVPAMVFRGVKILVWCKSPTPFPIKLSGYPNFVVLWEGGVANGGGV